MDKTPHPGIPVRGMGIRTRGVPEFFTRVINAAATDAENLPAGLEAAVGDSRSAAKYCGLSLSVGVLTRSHSPETRVIVLVLIP